MKQTLIVLSIAWLSVACKKSIFNKEYCYECNVEVTGYPDYKFEAGCMTENEWKNFKVIDPLGRTLTSEQKERDCRRK